MTRARGRRGRSLACLVCVTLLVAACAPPGRSSPEVVGDALTETVAAAATARLALELYSSGDLPRETARTTLAASLEDAHQAALDLGTLEVPGPQGSRTRDEALRAVSDATSAIVTSRSAVSSTSDRTVDESTAALTDAIERLDRVQDEVAP